MQKYEVSGWFGATVWAASECEARFEAARLLARLGVASCVSKVEPAERRGDAKCQQKAQQETGE